MDKRRSDSRFNRCWAYGKQMCARAVACGLAAWCVAGLAYGDALQQYWTFDDGTGGTATNTVPGGNLGTLVNFADGGWTSDRPAGLPHSTGALMFSAASSNYVDGGAFGLPSVATKEGATASLWGKPRTIIEHSQFVERKGGLS